MRESARESERERKRERERERDLSRGRGTLPRSLTKPRYVPTALRDCETRRLVGKICDKLNKESNDGESDREEPRVSRNLFELFEQTDRAEKSATTAARGVDQGTERAEQGHSGEQQRCTNPSPERDELEQAIQSTVTYLNNLSMYKPSPPILIEAHDSLVDVIVERAIHGPSAQGRP